MLEAESESAEEGPGREGVDRPLAIISAGSSPAAAEGEGLEPGGEPGAGQALDETVTECEGPEPGGERGAGPALEGAVTEGERLEPGGGLVVGQGPVEVVAEGDGPDVGQGPILPPCRGLTVFSTDSPSVGARSWSTLGGVAGAADEDKTLPVLEVGTGKPDGGVEGEEIPEARDAAGPPRNSASSRSSFSET